MNQQPSAKSKTRTRRSRASLIVWGALLLLLYFLSAGPATWIVYRWCGGFEPGSTSQPLLDSVYAPADWLAERAPRPVAAAWTHYVNFFFERAYRADQARWIEQLEDQQPADGAAPPEKEKTPDAARTTAPAERLIGGRTLAEWQDVLKSIDPAAPQAAKEVPGLIELIQDSGVPWFTRRQGALALGRMKSRALPAVPVLIRLIESRTRTDQDPSVSASAATWGAQALAHFGPDAASAAPTLIKQLDDVGRPLGERLAAVEALAMIGPAHPDVIPALIRVLDAPPQTSDADEADAATRTLPPPDDDHATLREAAAEAFTAMGAASSVAVPALIRALHDPSEGLRHRAANALGVLGPQSEAAVPDLLVALAFDDSDSVRDAAGSALGKIGGSAIEGLLRCTTQADQELRRRAASALGDSGERTARVKDALARLLNDEDPAVRIAAAVALWKIDPGSELVAPALVRILASDNRQHRLQASRLLVRMGPAAQPVLESLRVLLRHDDEEVRRLAAKTLGDIEARSEEGRR